MAPMAEAEAAAMSDGVQNQADNNAEASAAQEPQMVSIRRDFRETALWVLPLYRNMDTHIGSVGSTEVVRWEVEGHA